MFRRSRLSSATRSCRKTSPPATTGELCPSPTGTRHTTRGSPVQGATISIHVPSRRGPRNCGQSSARAELATTNVTRAKRQRIGGPFLDRQDVYCRVVVADRTSVDETSRCVYERFHVRRLTASTGKFAPASVVAKSGST